MSNLKSTSSSPQKIFLFCLSIAYNYIHTHLNSLYLMVKEKYNYTHFYILNTLVSEQ